MPKFLVEVPHEAEQTACMRAAEVLLVLPPGFRREAKIVRLNKFTMEDLDYIRQHH